MKKMSRMLATVLVSGFISSCDTYSCPTYARYKSEQENIEVEYAGNVEDQDDLDYAVSI